MKTEARLVTRASQNPNDGIILGVRMKGSSVLQLGRVYEIREVLGELIIVDIGPSAVKESLTEYDVNDYSLPCSWGNSVGWLLECYPGYLWLTEAEAKAHLNRSEKE